MTPPASDFGPALALTLAALNIVNILYTWWRTRDQNVETRFRAGSERMDRLDHRLASVEQTLRNLPSKDDLHALNLAISDLHGDLREIRASQTAAAEVTRRQELVVSRVEQYLLERSGK